MTDPRTADDAPLNAPDVEGPAKLAQLRGEELHEDQDGAIAAGEVDERAALTDTEIDEGELEAPGGSGDAGVDLESLASSELRSGETDNPDVAAEEGLAWVPPIDPPVIADRDAPGGAVVAAGFGMTAQDEPFDADHHGSALPADDEVAARVHEALAADARTSRLEGQIEVEAEDGIVRLRGPVDDLDDSDMLAEVAGQVAGVTDVFDETEVRGL